MGRESLHLVLALTFLAACQSKDEKLAPSRGLLHSIAGLHASQERLFETYLQMGNLDHAKAKGEEMNQTHQRLLDQKSSYIEECTPLFDRFTCERQAESIIQQGKEEARRR